jgi:DNA repair protein RadA
MAQGPLEIEDLPGVGPSTADKLREAGYLSVESIATASPAELSEISEISESTAKKIIKAAREAADIGGFKTGKDIFEQRKDIRKLSFRVPELDALMGGGLETQAITEMYGEFGSGKSQIVHQMAVNVQLSEDQGGLNGSAIDNADPQEFLNNIHIARAHTSDHQMLLIDNSRDLAAELKDSERPVKLFIIDSLTAHFRAEYAGRGTLAARQQKLNRHMHELFKLIDEHNAVALVTNQVMSNPAVFFGDPTKPIGGNIVGHTATFRLYLRKSKGGKRIARLVDSPNLPEGEAPFMVEEAGLKSC